VKLQHRKDRNLVLKLGETEAVERGQPSANGKDLGRRFRPLRWLRSLRREAKTNWENICKLNNSEVFQLKKNNKKNEGRGGKTKEREARPCTVQSGKDNKSWGCRRY